MGPARAEEARRAVQARAEAVKRILVFVVESCWTFERLLLGWNRSERRKEIRK